VPVSVALLGVFAVTMRRRLPEMMPTDVLVPCSFVWVVLDVPRTVVFAPSPIASAPITVELLSLLFFPRQREPI
jgi:hypothetical protein